MSQQLFKHRRDEVRTTTTTEIVLVLLLIISLFAYYANEKANIKERKIDLLNMEIEQLQKDNVELKKIIIIQKREIKDLNDRIVDLKKLIEAMPPDNPAIKFKDLGDEITKLKKRLEALLADNERLKKGNQALKTKTAALQGLGHGGSDWRRCLENETPRFIFKVVLSRNGYKISKSSEWLGDVSRYNAMFYGVPGVKGILSSGQVVLKEFESHAQKIYNWGKLQTPKCRFRVRLVLGIVKDPTFPIGIHNDLRQAVEDSFYIKISKNG